MEMDLLGWYDTSNNAAGTTKELVVEGTDDKGNPVYGDDRKIQKYYVKVDGEYPTAFKPQF